MCLVEGRGLFWYLLSQLCTREVSAVRQSEIFADWPEANAFTIPFSFGRYWISYEVDTNWEVVTKFYKIAFSRK